MTVASDPSGRGKQVNKDGPGSRRLRIYQHSDLMYWWVVWLYGFFGAVVTYFFGDSVTIGGQAVLVYPKSWLGLSTILLILFVAVFTNLKARGVYSLTFLLAIALLVAVVQFSYGWDRIVVFLPLLKVHMNLAFYLLLSSVLCVVWAMAMFGFDRLTYWYFSPGEVGKRVIIGEGSETFVAQNVQLQRHAYDPFVHRFLGLWFLGFGTGDLEVRFSSPGGERLYSLKNVWNIGKREAEITKLMAAKVMAQPASGRG
jgi:hypothetical protein